MWAKIAIAVAIAATGLTEVERRAPATARVEWRDSVAVGEPESGGLVRGVRLPAQGRHFFTWDPVLRRQPDRDWRRWGTDELVRTTLAVVREFARAHPRAPRVGVGDLSLPQGGYFGPEVGGGIGHATHQNGLDVDVYYPRLDRREGRRGPSSRSTCGWRRTSSTCSSPPARPRSTSARACQLEGPPGVVVPLVNHDNHLHARIAP